MLKEILSGAPDWQAEEMRLVDDNARPDGSVPLSVVYEQVGVDILSPLTIIPTIPRRTNGFGGRSKTHRAIAYEASDCESHAPSLQGQITRLDELRAEVEREIDDPTRLFVKWVEEEDFEGEIYLNRVYIEDEEAKEEIRKQERDTMATILPALRISIFEGHPRTRGFPSPRRIRNLEDAYHNVAFLRSEISDRSEDPLLKAMLADLENRLTQGSVPKGDELYPRRPEWIESYMYRRDY